MSEYTACDLNTIAYSALRTNSHITLVEFPGNDKYLFQDAYQITVPNEEAPMLLLVESKVILFKEKYFSMRYDTCEALKKKHKKDKMPKYSACDLNDIAYTALKTNSHITPVKFLGNNMYPAQGAYQIPIPKQDVSMFLLDDSRVILFDEKSFVMRDDTRGALRCYKLKQWYEKNRALIWISMGVGFIAMWMMLNAHSNKRKEESRNVEPIEQTMSNYLAAKQNTANFSNDLQKCCK